MSPRHHLGEATLVSFAAGALSPEMSAVAATHLEGCRHCRELLREAESIGGVLLARQQAAGPEALQSVDEASLREDILGRLDEPAAAPRQPFAQPRDTAADADELPRSLQPYFGRTWSALRWKWAAPGLHMIRAEGTAKDRLIMLKVAPGRSMPVHSHQGTELTQILKGSYTDSLGLFGPGDAADLDHETEHQPVSTPGTPCICVAALDAPLRFPGWFARQLQPYVGL